MVQRAVRSEIERGAMATERLSMRQIREILRQKWTLGRTHRQVAEGLRVGLGTVSTVERRARAAGLDWALVGTLTDEGLEARVYGPPTPPTHHRAVPDCASDCFIAEHGVPLWNRRPVDPDDVAARAGRVVGGSSAAFRLERAAGPAEAPLI